MKIIEIVLNGERGQWNVRSGVRHMQTADWQTADCRLQTCRLQTVDCRLADCRLADCRLNTSGLW